MPRSCEGILPLCCDEFTRPRTRDMDGAIPLSIQFSVRSLFISDLHLGFRHAQVKPLLQLLRSHEPEWLYLVGDFIDGWYLQNGWHWQHECDLIMQRILELARNGTRIRLAIGNHDRFLRTPVVQSILNANGLVAVEEEFHHELADGRRFLILHGDQFDRCENVSRLTCWFLCRCYEGLLRLNSFWGWLTQCSVIGHRSLISRFKSRLATLTQNVQQFKSNLTRHARHRGCDGVICGHIHAPQVHELDGVTYCNTGDWVENCSALVETHDGQLTLVHADHCASNWELMPSSDAVHDFTAANHLTRNNTRGEWESLTAMIQSERSVQRTS